MHNFDLQATQTPQGNLRLAVTASTAGECGPLLADWPAVTTRQALAAGPAEQARLGTALAAALPASVWALWREALGHARGEGVRLRLRTDSAAAALPWELLYDAERGLFLGRDALTPLVRYLEGPIPLLPFAPGPQAALLLAGASPADLPALQTGEALAQIQARVQGTPLRVAAAEPHLETQRLGVLITTQQPVVFHFYGHTGFDTRRGESCLVLEDARGAGVPLSAAQLAAALRSQGVQLAVLAACDGADTGAAPWAGLAQALVRAGVPSVLAMQGQVSAGLADAFLDTFYAALAAGRPYDVATNLARNVAALASLGTRQPGAWLQPQLFMRSDDARLWAAPATAAPRLQGDGHNVTIGTVYAGVVITSDLTNPTFDFRGAQIGAGTPAGANAAAGQEQGRQLVQAQLERLLALQQEQAAVLDALARRQLNDMDLNTVLVGLQELFVEVQRHNNLLLRAGESLDLAQTQAALADSGLGVKQRFKLTLPLLLWFLSYEAEFEWDGRIDLQAAWERLRARSTPESNS